MTQEKPEQIAHRIVNEENTALVEANRSYWVKRITQSITVAVAVERERCARIAEGQAEFVGGGECETLCRSIADLIRVTN